jgi:hypothetical protein
VVAECGSPAECRAGNSRRRRGGSSPSTAGGCRTVWETRRKGSTDLGPDARSFLGFDPHDEEAREALGRLLRNFMYP